MKDSFNSLFPLIFFVAIIICIQIFAQMVTRNIRGIRETRVKNWLESIREKLFGIDRNGGNPVFEVGSCQFYGRLNCAANNGEKVDRSLENLRCRRRLYIRCAYFSCTNVGIGPMKIWNKNEIKEREELLERGKKNLGKVQRMVSDFEWNL